MSRNSFYDYSISIFDATLKLPNITGIFFF